MTIASFLTDVQNKLSIRRKAVDSASAALSAGRTPSVDIDVLVDALADKGPATMEAAVEHGNRRAHARAVVAEAPAKLRKLNDQLAACRAECDQAYTAYQSGMVTASRLAFAIGQTEERMRNEATFLATTPPAEIRKKINELGAKYLALGLLRDTAMQERSWYARFIGSRGTVWTFDKVTRTHQYMLNDDIGRKGVADSEAAIARLEALRVPISMELDMLHADARAS